MQLLDPVVPPVTPADEPESRERTRRAVIRRPRWHPPPWRQLVRRSWRDVLVDVLMCLNLGVQYRSFGWNDMDPLAWLGVGLSIPVFGLLLVRRHYPMTAAVVLLLTSQWSGFFNDV